MLWKQCPMYIQKHTHPATGHAQGVQAPAATHGAHSGLCVVLRLLATPSSGSALPSPRVHSPAWVAWQALCCCCGRWWGPRTAAKCATRQPQQNLWAQVSTTGLRSTSRQMGHWYSSKWEGVHQGGRVAGREGDGEYRGGAACMGELSLHASLRQQL
jgi:hypothetical protein